MNMLRTAAAALALMAPAALCTTTAAAAPAPAGDTEPRTTLVVLDIDGCADNCEVQLVQSFEGRDRIWFSREKTTSDGVVRFRVDSVRTTGMTIAVTPRWHRQNYVPMVAVHYAGMNDGQVVREQVAAHKRRAYGCLEGTRQPVMKLDLEVDRFTSRGVTGDPVETARVYTQEAVPALAPLLRTFRGSLGAQDAIACER